MRDVIQKLNKKTLADETGISYSRLRKYSSGVIKDLTTGEKVLILQYLSDISHKIKEETIDE